MIDEDLERTLHQQVIDAAVRYYEVKHKNGGMFKPGDRISYGGRVFDENEIIH